MIRVVLDTNVLVSALLFEGGRLAWIRQSWQSWQSGSITPVLAKPTARELLRVLAYPHLLARQALRGINALDVLAQFDQHAHSVPSAERAPYVCNDTDDQKFIDLAVQHTAALHSKDAQVLCMKKRLERCGVVLNPTTA